MAYLVAMETPAALSRNIWERTPLEAQAYIEALEAHVAALVAMVQAFQKQLHQPSRNASRPPSSDPPQLQRPSHPRGQRRRGGQPGHPGHTRTLLPVEDVDEVVVLKPAQGTHCQAPLASDDPTPWRHQVIELPPIKPVVTEYQWHQLACPACGETTRAPWPAGVPSRTYGPRAQATVTLCTGAYRLSKRTTQQVMEEVFGVPLSVGTISLLEQATTAAVAAPVEAARRYVHRIGKCIFLYDLDSRWRGRGWGTLSPNADPLWWSFPLLHSPVQYPPIIGSSTANRGLRTTAL
jgi:transposase